MRFKAKTPQPDSRPGLARRGGGGEAELFLGLLVLVLDVLPQLALVVRLPDVVGAGVETPFKQQGAH